MRELYKNIDIVAVLKRRLEWIGHVVGMVQRRIIKKIIQSKPEGSRRRGRPRWGWLEDVGKDIWEMKVRRWRQKAVNREEWVSVNKQTKALRGPQSRGVTK